MPNRPDGQPSERPRMVSRPNRTRNVSMYIYNRTMKGLLALYAALTEFGEKSPEVAELGGLHYTRNPWRRSMPGSGGLRTAAQHKRAARKRQNIRARTSARR